MTFGGDGRVVGLAVPKEIPQGKSLALVLAFHGDGGNGPDLRTVFDVAAFSKGDAIVAYPTSSDFGWDLTLPAAANKDIPWVDALVASLSASYPIDARRVFAAGFSKGAFFSDQIACSKSGFLRGVSVHSGGAPYDPDGKVGRYPNGYVQCDATETGVAALVIHGESDGTVAFGSGEYATKYWSYVNGCGGDQVPWATDPSCLAQVACPDALPVTFCAVPGLDHAVWPKAAQVTWEFFAGL
jgi:polyhydroxybutyrate depolymerase